MTVACAAEPCGVLTNINDILRPNNPVNMLGCYDNSGHNSVCSLINHSQNRKWENTDKFPQIRSLLQSFNEHDDDNGGAYNDDEDGGEYDCDGNDE